MWLLPVLSIFACMLIPLIVAMVMYWLLIDRIRRSLAVVRVEAERRFGG